MTKSELKTGYILTERCGDEWIVILNPETCYTENDLSAQRCILLQVVGSWNDLSKYNEDLTHFYSPSHDIVKVEEASHPYTFMDLNYDKGNRKLLWERNEMSSKSDKEIMQNAINTYGLENQMIKTIEELAELSQSLSKALVRLNSKSDKTLSADLKSVNNIFEEMADVEIMIEQCKMMFKCKEEVQNWKEKKISRLAKRLENE